MNDNLQILVLDSDLGNRKRNVNLQYSWNLRIFDKFLLRKVFLTLVFTDQISLIDKFFPLSCLSCWVL